MRRNNICRVEKAKRVNQSLIISNDGKKWYNVSGKHKSSNSKIKTNTRINELPRSIRRLGRLARSYRISKVHMYVYRPIITKNENDKKIIHFVIKTCDDKLCNGQIRHDEHEDKICEKCGLMEIDYTPKILSNDPVVASTLEFNYGDKLPTIKDRNESWDDLDFEEYLNKNDEGSEELKARYARIKEYEEKTQREAGKLA